MRRVLPSIVIGLILGTAALLPFFVSAAGHDSRTVFVDLANSVAFEWPFLLAERVAPGPTAGSLGIVIHYTFYVLIAWLLLSFLPLGRSRPAD